MFPLWPLRPLREKSFSVMQREADDSDRRAALSFRMHPAPGER
jgi:hypothetical protein